MHSLLHLHCIPIYDEDVSAMRVRFFNHLFMESCRATEGLANVGLACRVSGTFFHSSMRTEILRSLLSNDLPTEHLLEIARALGLRSVEEAEAKSDEDVRTYVGLFCETTRGKYSNATAVSLLDRRDPSNRFRLLVLCRIHQVVVSGSNSTESLKNLFVQHLWECGCSLAASGRSLAVEERCRLPDDDVAVERGRCDLIQSLLDASAPTKTLRRLLVRMNIEFEVEPSNCDMRQCKRTLELYLSLSNGDSAGGSRSSDSRSVRVARSVAEITRTWPSIVSREVKDELLRDFFDATSTEALKEQCCAVCGEMKTAMDVVPGGAKPSDFDLSLIRRSLPRGAVDPFLRDESLRGCMLDHRGVQYEFRGEVGLSETTSVLTLCRECHRSLSSDRLPKLALANELFVGEIPEALSDLTVVEEAMVSQRRAKCWILHLREEGTSNEVTEGVSNNTAASQRALKGHIIVFPTHPERLGRVLPPPMEDVVSPICVLFVGSSPPTKEWLRTKARPLIVRREKVRCALEWMKEYNPLYSHVLIDYSRIDSLPEYDIAPVDISVEDPCNANAAEGSGYANYDSELHMSDTESDDQESEFQSVVITDVDGNDVSSREMRLAALRHLRSGGKFIQIPHDEDPSNEYDDEHLFPLLYPTLFPFGCGGFELQRRSIHLDMGAQVQHYLKLADRRFQRHRTFLFVCFNMLQRRAVTLHAKLKVARAGFQAFSTSLYSVSEEDLMTALSEANRTSKDGLFVPTNDAQRIIQRLLNEVQLVSQKVPGTSGARIAMRNEIRGMMMNVGLPSLYVTINPADVYNPVVRLLAGEEIDIDDILPNEHSTYWDQAKAVAENPCLGAKFFDVYIRAFLSFILGYSSSDEKRRMGGIVGVVKGYYGCV